MHHSNTESANSRTEVQNDMSRWPALKQDLKSKAYPKRRSHWFTQHGRRSVRRELRLGAEELCRYQPDLLSLSERKRLDRRVG